MKVRLDQRLVNDGLAASREQAQRVIRVGSVFVDGQRRDKPGCLIATAAAVVVRGEACPYVSRGGLKLEGALARFGLSDLGGAGALDVGSSTGGFTDCLLRHGAGHVWAIDVGRGQLHERLRRDPRVSWREGLNARHLALDWLGEVPAQIVSIDVSFISLRLILPRAAAVLAPGGRVVALVKPQFEADRRAVRRGGVIRDRATHRRVLESMVEYVLSAGWRVEGVCPSPVAGPAGNREFFLLLSRGDEGADKSDRPAMAGAAIQIAIERALDEIYNQLEGCGDQRAPGEDSASRPKG